MFAIVVFHTNSDLKVSWTITPACTWPHNSHGLLAILRKRSETFVSTPVASKYILKGIVLFSGSFSSITDNRHIHAGGGPDRYRTHNLLYYIPYLNLYTICNMRCNCTVSIIIVLCRIRKTTKFHSACGKKWKRIPQPNARVLTSGGLKSKNL